MAITPSPELEQISRRLAAEKGLDDDARLALVDSYLGFLSKAAGSGGAVFPSVAVDEMWHRHILDTQSYGRDCERWFGTFIHHQPDLKPVEAPPNGAANCSAPQPPTCNSLRGDQVAANCGAPEPEPPCRGMAATLAR